MSEHFIIIILIGIIGVGLTFARRYNNTDKEAGSGVVFWTIFLMIVVLMDKCS